MRIGVTFLFPEFWSYESLFYWIKGRFTLSDAFLIGGLKADLQSFIINELLIFRDFKTFC